MQQLRGLPLRRDPALLLPFSAQHSKIKRSFVAAALAMLMQGTAA